MNYEKLLENTNVTTYEDVVQTFDERFEQPIESFDYSSIADELIANHNNKWEIPDYMKKLKGSIAKIQLNKGSICKLSNKFNGQLLFKGFQSNFCKHCFAFADENKKKLLETPFDEVNDCDVKDLMKCKLSFDIGSSNKQIQSSEVFEQAKLLYVINNVILKEIIASNPEYEKCRYDLETGFITQEYCKYHNDDIFKMQLHVIPFGKQATQVVKYNSSTNQIESLEGEYKTVRDFMTLIQRKNIDFTVYIDSVAVAKTGRNLQIYPKLVIHQIIIHDYINKTNKTPGLNLTNIQ